MAADLTVDRLCEALRFFFQQILEHPDTPVDREKGMVLFGTPGDDEMRALMEVFGGTIKITVNEMPIAMQQVFASDIAESQGAVIWEPSKEKAESETWQTPGRHILRELEAQG